MKHEKIAPAVLLLVLLGLTAWRWEALLAAGISLSTYLILSLREGWSPAAFWTPAALEYWLAFVGWIVAGAILVSWLANGQRDLSRRMRTPVVTEIEAPRLSSLILAVMVFVAVCTPLLVPVEPNAQGNLITTRLLPPLSMGRIQPSLSSVNGRPDAARDELQERYRKANRKLFGKDIQLTGVGRTPDPLSATSGDPFLFLFGTDDAGRDVCSRVLAGTRISLGIGIAAALGAILIGGCLGFIAGTWGSWVDSLVMRTTDLFLSLPGIIIVVALLAFIGQSVWSLILVLALTGWMSTARIVRSEVQVIRQKEYIAAARLFRVSTPRIMIRHILPNVRPLLVTAAVLQFGNAVLGEAALSFLGLGIQPPTPSWGNMIGEAVAYTSRGWWVGLFPGILLSTVLLVSHRFGEQ